MKTETNFKRAKTSWIWDVFCIHILSLYFNNFRCRWTMLEKPWHSQTLSETCCVNLHRTIEQFEVASTVHKVVARQGLGDVIAGTDDRKRWGHERRQRQGKCLFFLRPVKSGTTAVLLRMFKTTIWVKNIHVDDMKHQVSGGRIKSCKVHKLL